MKPHSIGKEEGRIMAEKISTHTAHTHTHDTDLYKTGAKEVLILERAT